MAREAEHREDMFAEATALVERAELRVASYSDPVLIGRRANGCWSIHFGGDPVFHFNSRCELRRAFVADVLIAAETGALVSLTRRRGDSESHLVRHLLTAEETAEFLADVKARLTFLGDAIQTGDCGVIRSFPDDCNVVGQFVDWLRNLGEEIHVAARPNAD